MSSSGVDLWACPTRLVPRHGADDHRADHPRQGAHAVGDAHEDAGVARGDVQVVDIETL